MVPAARRLLRVGRATPRLLAPGSYGQRWVLEYTRRDLKCARRRRSPESQPQKSDKPSDAWRVAKTGLTLSLELADAVAGALPIPGIQLPFTIALRIIKGINVGCLSLVS